MKSATRFLTIAFVLGAMLSAGGCAVLTVDVDVYKGPLANHVDVQTQQTAVLALAAKPMLAKLRFLLEAYARGDTPVGNAESHSFDLQLLKRSSNWIPEVQFEPGKSSGMPDDVRGKQDFDPNKVQPKQITEFAFRSPQAEFINRILAEYNDPEEQNQQVQQETEDKQREHDTLDQFRSRVAKRANQQDSKERARIRAKLSKARGRPGPGLEWLFYNYIHAKFLYEEEFQQSNPGQLPELSFFPEQDKFFDALVHFSEKIRFNANNEVLFAEHPGAGAAFGDVMAFFAGGPDISELPQSYVRVLQTIGNTIQVSLDELREYMAHQQVLQTATTRESLGFANSARPDPYALINNIVRAAIAEKEQQKKILATKYVDATHKDAESLLKDADAISKAAQGAGVAQAEIDRAKAIVAIRDRVNKLQHAIDAISKHAHVVLDDLEWGESPYPPSSVIIDRLEIAMTGGIAYALLDEATQDAVDYLDEPHDFTHAFPYGDNPTNAKDVLDQLIASLRYEYLQVVTDEGTGSPHAQHIQDALDAAYAQRSGMIYIRPASAYLRTSFPSTSLQRDARLGFHNDLLQLQAQQLPFAGFFNNPTEYRTLQELDKQFWQNINTVRVAGGGLTNYVVAKDDIGNWYVKNFSANPKDIIKSMKNLALFSLGPALKNNLLRLPGARQGSKGTGTGSTTDSTTAPNSTTPTDAGAAMDAAAAQPSVLQDELTASQKAYTDATTKDITDVQAAAAALGDKVANAWTNDSSLKGYADKLTPTGGPLDSAKTTHLAPIAQPAAAGDTTPPSDRIINDLEAMKRFHNALPAKIQDTLVKDPAAALKKAQDAKKTADQQLAAAAQAVTDSDAKITAATKDDNDAKKAIDNATKERDQAKQQLDNDTSAGKPASVTTADKQVFDSAQSKLDAATTLQQKTTGPSLATAKTDNAALVQKKSEAQATAKDAQTALDKAQQDLDAAYKASATARQDMTGVVRDAIKPLLQRRQTTVQKRQTELSLIAKSAAPASNSAAAAPAPAPAK